MFFEFTNPEIAIFMMGLFLFAVLLGFPIAFTLLAMGVGFGYYAYFDPTRMDHLLDNRIFSLLVSNTYTIMDNNVLTAVPLFLFMGYLVERAGIVSRLFFAIRLALHGLPASMAVAALVTCALFSTATGIIALAFYGYEYAALAWKIKETSWNSPAQIQIYMAKSLIPLSGALLTIQGVSEVFRSIICIQTGHWPARMVVAEETEKILMRTSQEEDNQNAV